MRIGGGLKIVLITAGLMTGGCQDPLAAKQAATRQERIERLVRDIEKSERTRADRLAAMRHQLDRTRAHHEESRRQHAVDYREAAVKEVERFRQRRPEYERVMRELWDGRPERVGEQAIWMFY